jgi:hypothetical protein
MDCLAPMVIARIAAELNISTQADRVDLVCIYVSFCVYNAAVVHNLYTNLSFLQQKHNHTFEIIFGLLYSTNT